MGEYICLDIYGNEIVEIIFNNDGTISGLLPQTSGVYLQPFSSYGGNQYPSSNLTELTKECCERFNFTYDDNTRKCYHNPSCVSDSDGDISPIINEISERIDSLEVELSSPTVNILNNNLISANYALISPNDELISANDELNELKKQLRPNNIKLIFGAENNNPILFEVEGAQGDLDPNQEKECDVEIFTYNRKIKELNDRLSYHNTVITTILITIDTRNQSISDLQAENIDLGVVLATANATANATLAIETIQQIDVNNSQIGSYSQEVVMLNNQINTIEAGDVIINDEIIELQVELDGLIEICNPTPPPCNLNIEFDYLWNFDCEELLNCSSGDGSMLEYLGVSLGECNSESERIENEIGVVNSQILNIGDSISNAQEGLTNLEAQLVGNIDPIQVYQIEVDIDNLNQLLIGYTNQYIEYQSQLTPLQEGLIVQDQLCAQIQIQIDNLNEYGNLVSSLQNVVFYLTIEKKVLNPTTGQYIWETTYVEEFFRIDNLLEHITNNAQTGIYFSGDKCDDLIENIGIQLGENCDTISANTFNSQWLHLSTTIDASTVYNGNNVLLEIANEEIAFGVMIDYDNANCQHCFMVDRIEMNQTCEKTDKVNVLVNRCPNFELKRVMDNKKSWMDISSGHTRDFDLVDRETFYKTIHHKATINSKELDLELNPAHAIELDVFSYNSIYPCILSGSSGETNYLEYISTDIDEINNVDEFNYVLTSELIDVKSRKVISAYPALRAIYDRYLSPSDYGCTGTTSNAYTYSVLIEFTKLLGTFWIDLIEQAIPSTAIWGSVYRYGNSVFDTDKYQYKRYSTSYCTPTESNCSVNGGSADTVNVIIEDLSKDNTSKYPKCFIAGNIIKSCDYIQTNDYNDSCEYMGRVIVISPEGDGNDNPYDGGGFALTEDINYYSKI